ncbi:hypothetical protein J8J27_22635, partial [Mycobacterium tuberculosis]|nr:hypothetical protein [Mycobacterium tuberculosis]
EADRPGYGAALACVKKVLKKRPVPEHRTMRIAPVALPILHRPAAARAAAGTSATESPQGAVSAVAPTARLDRDPPPLRPDRALALRPDALPGRVADVLYASRVYAAQDRPTAAFPAGSLVSLAI